MNKEIINQIFGRDDWFDSRSRKREIVEPRHCYIWFQKHRTKMSLNAIGRLFPTPFDHSTIIHAVNNWDWLLETSSQHRSIHDLVKRKMDQVPEWRVSYEVGGVEMVKEFSGLEGMNEFFKEFKIKIEKV